MNISLFTGGLVQTNGYLIETQKGHLLVDAPSGIRTWLQSKEVFPTDLLLTHQHYDHVEDAAALHSAGAAIHAYEAYSPTLTLAQHARQWGLPISVDPFEVTKPLNPGAPFEIHGLKIELLHVPGHSPDSVAFYFPEEGILFSGDTLFARSVGRPDLPGGDEKLLLEGIATKLLTLPPDTHVYPGHGPSTTVRKELKENPYL